MPVAAELEIVDAPPPHAVSTQTVSTELRMARIMPGVGAFGERGVCEEGPARGPASK